MHINQGVAEEEKLSLDHRYQALHMVPDKGLFNYIGMPHSLARLSSKTNFEARVGYRKRLELSAICSLYFLEIHNRNGHE